MIWEGNTLSPSLVHRVSERRLTAGVNLASYGVYPSLYAKYSVVILLKHRKNIFDRDKIRNKYHKVPSSQVNVPQLTMQLHPDKSIS